MMKKKMKKLKKQNKKLLVLIIMALIPTPLVFNKHTPAPKVHARTIGPCPHRRSTPTPKVHAPRPHRMEPHPASVHSASPSCPQRCTLRGRRQVADRLPSGGDPAGSGRIISVVFSDACSDSTHARGPLLCPLLLTRVRMKLQSDRVNVPFKDQTALPRLLSHHQHQHILPPAPRLPVWTLMMGWGWGG